MTHVIYHHTVVPVLNLSIRKGGEILAAMINSVKHLSSKHGRRIGRTPPPENYVQTTEVND